MGNDQKNFEITDEETGEVFPINAVSLVSNVRDVLMSRRRNQQEARVWGDLSEEQQQDEITAIQMLASDLVGKVVEVVATRGLTCAHVEVNKFAVDVEKGEVVITSKGFASDEMLVDLAHSKGKTAKLTIVDVRQFNEKSTLMVADKDQGNMFPDQDDIQGDVGNDHVSDDDMYARVVALVKADQKCSTSYVQRKLAIGYNKAARFIERMEADGLVSAPDHVGKREILFDEQSDADLAAGMDADLDDMDEPDDLHEPEVSVEEPDNSAEYMGGFNSREHGYGQGLNPFFGDAGTEQQFKDWDDGWRGANDLPGMIDVDPALGLPVDDTPEVEAEVEPDPVPEAEPEPEVEQEDAKMSDEDAASQEADAVAATEALNDEPDLGGLTPRAHGQQAMVKGHGPDDNPFDGGTDGHASWAVGYEDAAEEIEGLVETGRKAGAANEPKKSCPWKKGTDGERFWLKGWSEGIPKEPDA
jgi:ribosome modulation factor